VENLDKVPPQQAILGVAFVLVSSVVVVWLLFYRGRAGDLENLSTEEIGSETKPIPRLLTTYFRPISDLFRTYFEGLFSRNRDRLEESLRPRSAREILKDQPIVVLDCLTDLQKALPDLTPFIVFKDEVALHRFLAIVSFLSQDEAKDRLKGNTAQIQSNIREERERFKKRFQDDPWSRENREALKAQLKEEVEGVRMQSKVPNV
jgi:hypothetical protein